jgi:hypothetical protein
VVPPQATTARAATIDKRKLRLNHKPRILKSPIDPERTKSEPLTYCSF